MWGLVLAVLLSAQPEIEILLRQLVYPSREMITIPVRFEPGERNRGVVLLARCVEEDVEFLSTSREVGPEDRHVIPEFRVIFPTACEAVLVAAVVDAAEHPLATTSKTLIITH